MKTFRALIAEVAQPKPGDEKRFKAKHVIQQITDPNAKEGQFTTMKPKTPKRPADYDFGTDAMAYEGYVNVLGQDYNSMQDEPDEEMSIGQKSLRPDPIVARPTKDGTQIDDPAIRRQLALRRQMEIMKKIVESSMTPSQMKKREDIVKSMKSADFKKRYGKRADEVMYATATKMAMKEDLNEVVYKEPTQHHFQSVEHDKTGERKHFVLDYTPHNYTGKPESNPKAFKEFEKNHPIKKDLFDKGYNTNHEHHAMWTGDIDTAIEKQAHDIENPVKNIIPSRKPDPEQQKKRLEGLKLYKKMSDAGTLHDVKDVQEATDWDSDAKKEREVTHWNVVNKTNDKVVGKASTKKGARASMDKHDTKHGGYAHKIVPVWKDAEK